LTVRAGKRVFVTTENRYLRTPEGVYTSGLEDGRFFSRYRDVFDRVTVIARVARGDVPPKGARDAGGPGIDFLDLPDFRGLSGVLWQAGELAAVLGKLAASDDGPVILRSPGVVSSLVFAAVRVAGRRFGVEVVTDPAQAYDRATLPGAPASLIRRGAVILLRLQCAEARAAAYVTRGELQARYPSRSSAVFSYSSVRLSENVFRCATATQARIETKPDRLERAQVLFVGRLDRPFKGLDVLLEAWAKLEHRFPEARLSIVGDGALQPEYEAQADALGLGERVRFLGAVDSGQPVYDLMSEHDLLVLPSRREGLPRVVIEAMAVGLPCVATNVCGARELLRPDDRVEIGDADGLARAVSGMLSSRRRRLEASERNARVARSYADDLLQPERRRFYTVLADELAPPSPATVRSAS